MPTLDYIVAPVAATAHRFRVVLHTEVQAGAPVEAAPPGTSAEPAASLLIVTGGKDTNDNNES